MSHGCGDAAPDDDGFVRRVDSNLDEIGQVLMSVSDTAVGLPNGNAEQILNAIFTTKSEGTGLGLEITRSVVE